jgi:uncharacterized protein YjbJ (UPF0337 family)
MNKHQVKGAAREVAGKVQKKVGKATSNGTQALKGSVREAAGKAQKAYGNAKEDAKAGARTGARRSRTTARDRDIERHAH